MKCMTCDTREAEGEKALCTACDRDEWREATIGANERLRKAEDKLRRMYTRANRYVMMKEGCNCCPNHEELMYKMADALNKGETR